MNWSNWENIEKLPDYEGKGVYRFRLVDNKGKSISIQRFLGEDKDGIIIIGETENIKTRLKQFNKVVLEKKISPFRRFQFQNIFRILDKLHYREVILGAFILSQI